jgi:hypothetical protein
MKAESIEALPLLVASACTETAEACNESANPQARDWAGFFSGLAVLAEKLLPIVIKLMTQ